MRISAGSWTRRPCRAQGWRRTGSPFRGSIPSRKTFRPCGDPSLNSGPLDGTRVPDELPKVLDWIEAGAIPLVATTALQALRDVARLRPGERQQLPGLERDVEFCGAVPYGDALFALWDRAHATVITNVTATRLCALVLACRLASIPARADTIMFWANGRRTCATPRTAAPTPDLAR